jgi:hypothetical protein
MLAVSCSDKCSLFTCVDTTRRACPGCPYRRTCPRSQPHCCIAQRPPVLICPLSPDYHRINHHCNTSLMYPGLGLLEGTSMSEGRGTCTPFQTIGGTSPLRELFGFQLFFAGAPWLTWRFALALTQMALPCVSFREAYFIPTFSKWQVGAPTQISSQSNFVLRNRETSPPVLPSRSTMLLVSTRCLSALQLSPLRCSRCVAALTGFRWKHRRARPDANDRPPRASRGWSKTLTCTWAPTPHD